MRTVHPSSICCIISIVTMTTGLGAAAPAAAAAVIHYGGLSQQQGGSDVSAGTGRLSRPKRAEEIMYGNHQNEPRVKKSNDDSASHVTQPEVQSAILNGSKISSGDVTAGSTVNVKPEPEVKAVTSKQEVSENAPEVVDESDGEAEIQEVAPYEQHGDIYYPTEDEDGNYQLDSDQDATKFNDDSGSRDRRKRSSSVSMTAENMIDSNSEDIGTGRKFSGGRFKRGLVTSDDIMSWIDAQRQPESSLDYEQEADEGTPDSEEDIDPDYENRNALFANGRQADEYPYADPVQSEDDQEADREAEKVEELRSMLAKELLAEKAEDQVRDAVLQYLANADEEPESTLEEQQVPEPFLEEIDDPREPVLDQAPVENVDYVPVVYGGVRGIFIPESLPLAPVKKSPVYPSYYEPRGGRWSALTPLEAKRAADSYSRLYRLAEALKKYDEYSE